MAFEIDDYRSLCGTAERKELPEETPSYVVLSFTLKMKRKMVFSTYILTLPCVFLATLTLLVFWLPPDRPDRTSLAMSIFGSFLVLLLILVEAAPPTASSVPRLGLYYCFNMVIIMMSIFLSTLVVNVCRGADRRKPVPTWLKVITVDYIGRILCLQSRLAREKSHREPENPGTREESCRLLSNTPQHTKYAVVNLNGSSNSNVRYDHSVVSSSDANSNGILQGDMGKVLGSLKEMAATIVNNAQSEQRLGELKRSWQSVGLVLDRLFFYSYIIAIVLSLIFLFPRPE